MIVTKKLAPTNTRGARITATGGGYKVTIPYPHELNTFDAHLSAARQVAAKIGCNEMAVCDSPDRTGFVFVITILKVSCENPV